MSNKLTQEQFDERMNDPTKEPICDTPNCMNDPENMLGGNFWMCDECLDEMGYKKILLNDLK